MLLLSRTARRSRSDPNAFFEFCFRDPSGAFVRQAPIHRELQLFLTKQPRALVELPRDHGKSTQVCGRLVWELGREPSLRIILVCAAEHLAVNRGRFLRDAIADNARVRMVFPNLRPWRPWRVNAFAVERAGNAIGPSVSAFGVGGSSTGTRADLLVCDDIVDVKAVYSKAERDRVCEDFFNNLLNLLEPDGRFWSLSTPWHADDLNARLKRNGAYAVFRKPIGPELRTIWPQRWPKQALVKRREEIGTAAFARGYRLTPIAEDEVAIRPEWVKAFEVVPDEFDAIVLSVDPAVTVKANRDATAAVVLGRAENRIYVLAAVARRVAAPGMIDLIAELDGLWKPQTILFETNGAFQAVKDLLERHASFGPKVKAVTQSRSKAARVAAFAVSVENGSFVVRASQKQLIEEMTTFPFGEHDDLLDAAATGTGYLLGSCREPRIWVM